MIYDQQVAFSVTPISLLYLAPMTSLCTYGRSQRTGVIKASV